MGSGQKFVLKLGIVSFITLSVSGFMGGLGVNNSLPDSIILFPVFIIGGIEYLASMGTILVVIFSVLSIPVVVSLILIIGRIYNFVS